MSGPLLLDSKPTRLETDVQLEEDDGKTIIHTGSSLLLLEQDESTVFNLCNGQHTVKEIISQLSDVFKLPEAEIKDELVSFIEDLGKRGLLKWQ